MRSHAEVWERERGPENCIIQKANIKPLEIYYFNYFWK
ncbi:MAG: hypothetical protein K0Q74_1613 [Gammaproteobacteria bacterium]|jgi:hypothetical protein|nr:hypothetical protein [Gammaproteobacteria bacterium]